MALRDRLAALAYAFKSNNCLVPFKDQSALLREDCYEHVDRMLDVLTANPGGAVLRSGCAAGNADELRRLDVHLAGTIFEAMIRAIKEGK